jgi:ribosomal protein L19E
VEQKLCTMVDYQPGERHGNKNEQASQSKAWIQTIRHWKVA